MSRGCTRVSIEKSSNGRLLKKAASFVLGSKNPQRSPEGTPPVLSSPAASLDGLFEQPATRRIRPYA